MMARRLRGSGESTRPGDTGFSGFLAAIHESLTLKELEDAYVRNIGDVVAAKGHGIYAFDEQRKPMLVQARGVTDAFLDRYEDVRAIDPVLKIAVSTSRCAVSTELPERAWRREPFYELLASAGIYHAVQVPLVHRGELLGTLNLGRPEQWPFAAAEISRISAVARHVSIAMRRARRFEELDSRRSIVEHALDFVRLPLIVTALDGSLLFCNRSADALLDRWTGGADTTAVRDVLAGNARLLVAGRRVVNAHLPSAAEPSSWTERASARRRGTSGIAVRSTLVRSEADAVVSFVYESPAAAPVAVPVLSEREREIAELVARGLSNPQIATVASITPNTVKQHLKRIFRKLDVSSRSELAATVTRAGDAVLEPPPPLPPSS